MDAVVLLSLIAVMLLPAILTEWLRGRMMPRNKSLTTRCESCGLDAQSVFEFGDKKYFMHTDLYAYVCSVNTGDPAR